MSHGPLPTPTRLHSAGSDVRTTTAAETPAPQTVSLSMVDLYGSAARGLCKNEKLMERLPKAPCPQ